LTVTSVKQQHASSISHEDRKTGGFKVTKLNDNIRLQFSVLFSIYVKLNECSSAVRYVLHGRCPWL